MTVWLEGVLNVRNALSNVETMLAACTIPSDHLEPFPLLKVHPPSARKRASRSLRRSEMRVDSVLAALDELQEQTKHLHDAITTQQTRMRNSRSNALALPPEILERIFSFATALNDERKEYGGGGLVRTLSPLILSRVCRLWRNTAINSRPLWSHIVLPMPAFLLRLYAVRSGEHAIRLTIWEDTRQGCLEMPYGYRIDLSPSLRGRRPDLSMIQSRTRELSMSVYISGENPVCNWLHDFFDARIGLKALESLHVKADVGPITVMLNPVPTPSLRSVTLSGISLRHPEKRRAFISVTSLCYIREDEAENRLILDDLARFPRAQTLDVSTGGNINMSPQSTQLFDARPRLKLPHLRQLKLRDFAKQSCEAAMILHCIDAPELDSLDLSEVAAHDDANCNNCKRYRMPLILMEKVRIAHSTHCAAQV